MVAVVKVGPLHIQAAVVHPVASATLKLHGTNTAQPTYNAAGSSPAPITVSSLGYVSFYAPAGLYDIVFTYTGHPTQVYAVAVTSSSVSVINTAPTLPTPGSSDAGKVVQVNAGHTGYELATPSGGGGGGVPPVRAFTVFGQGNSLDLVARGAAAPFVFDAASGGNYATSPAPCHLTSGNSMVTFDEAGAYCLSFQGVADPTNTKPVNMIYNIGNGDDIGRNLFQQVTLDEVFFWTRTLRIEAGDTFQIYAGVTVQVQTTPGAAVVKMNPGISFLNIDRVGN